ncbi:citrate synthase [Oikeobacillus pervagus]|uniref:Citrate synthase n=1 Tax=Oikeobacillus pervagus TaxID=1325931 RepID=A0AAJ1WIZ8_9BACI|nr:hypothetical protein [Oikeobacillus pervagus]MDQ0214873.1 citrate synthase [Oikeobacillus pervagus]
MGQCPIDHTKEDVRKKFEAQYDYLPAEIISQFETFLENDHTQDVLNEVFHLLKKYDLSSEEERQKRNHLLQELL